MLKLFRIKLCGFTRAQDVRAAVMAGADAIGFQMSRGPRKIDPEKARRLVRLLPPWVTPVGVFVEEPLTRLNRWIRFCGFQVAQLHGDEDGDYARGVVVPVIKALRLKKALIPASFRGYSVAAFLLDRYNRTLSGGTGQTVPRTWVRKAPQLSAPFLLAGGINPENVDSAIRRIKPFGVDAASGVEISPGIKDPRRMVLFVNRAQAAFQSLQLGIH